MALTCSIYINVHHLFMEDELQKTMNIFHNYFCMLEFFCMDLSLTLQCGASIILACNTHHMLWSTEYNLNVQVKCKYP